MMVNNFFNWDPIFNAGDLATLVLGIAAILLAVRSISLQRQQNKQVERQTNISEKQTELMKRVSVLEEQNTKGFFFEKRFKIFTCLLETLEKANRYEQLSFNYGDEENLRAQVKYIFNDEVDEFVSELYKTANNYHLLYCKIHDFQIPRS